jgi:hypothetical protein
LSHSEDRLTWDGEIPTLLDIIDRGGKPGCQYAYVHVANMAQAQGLGFRTLQKVDGGVAVFHLVGPGGECDFVVAESGTAAVGVAPEASRQPLDIDSRILTETGLENLGAGLEEELTAPVAPRRAKATEQVASA